MATLETLKDFFATHVGDDVWICSIGQGGSGSACVEIEKDMSNFLADIDGWKVTDNRIPAEDFSILVKDIEQYQVLEFVSPSGDEMVQYLLWDVD